MLIPIASPSIDEKEIQAITKVLESGVIAQGAQVDALERVFSKFCGTKYAIAVNSGTAALHTALYVAGIQKGDEVITTPFSFIATANTILMQQAKPVFVDIDHDTFNIDPENIRRCITKKTKAIIAVDLYGNLADYERISSIAKEYGLAVIVDACQSVGAEYKGKRAGSFGNISAFSFYATKNITCGEGGMITTNNEEYWEKSKLFRQHGRSKMSAYEYEGLGYNYRMTDICAAMLLEQLKKVDSITRRRIENAAYLSKSLTGMRGITVPIVRNFGQHVFHQYTIRIEDNFRLKRDVMVQHLKERGIQAGIYYPKPLHFFKHFRKFGYKKGDFPVAETASQQVISLPVHARLTKKQLDYMIKVFRELK